jgi:hypothetical protein
METTEKIVEAYVRYVKGWFTIPNIKCKGQMEIDLLAVNVSRRGRIERYHIESGVSISGAFSKLTNKRFSLADLRKRSKQAEQRRTLGYFRERKFEGAGVEEKLESYGFLQNKYKKVIVSWGWDNNVPAAAEEAGIELWDFREILDEIDRYARSKKTYFIDDTMRTLQLMAKMMQFKCSVGS